MSPSGSAGPPNPYAPPTAQPVEPDPGRRARPVVAALLSFLGPGLGHFYAGHSLRALAAFAAAWLLYFGVYLLVQLGPGATWLLGVAAVALLPIDAFRTARRAARSRPSWLTVAALGVAWLFVGGALGTLARSHLYESFRVSSGPMRPVLLEGDYVTADKLAYVRGDPQRGDIAVFRWPDDPALLYLQRVIGLPGDVVEIDGSELRVNGEVLAHTPAGTYVDQDGELLAVREQIAADRSCTVLYPSLGSSGRPPQRWVVPEGAYFMLGDNRTRSRDSRFWRQPFVPRADVLGRIVSRYWSLDPATSQTRWDRIGPIEE